MPSQLFDFTPRDIMHAFAVTADDLKGWWRSPPPFLHHALQNLIDRRAPAKRVSMTLQNLIAIGITEEEAIERINTADFPFVVRHAVARASLKTVKTMLAEHEFEFLGEIIAYRFRRWTDRQFKSWKASDAKFLDHHDFEKYEARGIIMFDARRKFVRLTQTGAKLYHAYEERHVTPRLLLTLIEHRPTARKPFEIGPREKRLWKKLISEEAVIRHPATHVYTITTAGLNRLEDMRRAKPNKARKTVENRFQWVALCDPPRPRGEPPEDWREHFPMRQEDAPGVLSAPEFDTLQARNAICADPLTGCYIVLG